MLSDWNFDNSYLQLPKIFFTKTKPNNFTNLELILNNEKLIERLNLNKIEFKNLIIKSISENNNDCFSQAYAGHQFGHFTILGDGRATFLGEHLNKNNERYDIQLKGSGETPYSRNGDGKGTLKSMLREYIVSEAMHNLNINTTRSLAVLKTGEKINRNGFEEGGILVRVAKSHIRVGTFQLAALSKDRKDLEELLEYSINRLHPDISKNKKKYIEFYKKIVENQINLIVEWQRVGFIHGVMNTDNMALSGETIDYGPAAFMDEYNPNKVFSSIDHNGRYKFINQPKIVIWNLARLSETFLHLINKDEKLAIKEIEEILLKYQKKYKQLWIKMMKNKIGVNGKHEKDNDLINELLNLMHVFKMDYTNTFVNIQENNLSQFNFMKDWNEKLKERKKLNINNIKKNNHNPQIIPRNHIVEKVLNESEKGDYNNLNKLIRELSNPYNSVVGSEFLKEPKENEKVYETFCGT